MPSTLRGQILKLIHQGHLGTEKCLLKAKDSVFWPKISSDIKELTDTCETCQQYGKKQIREPLHPHNVPSYPWQKIGADLFDYKHHQYLLISDYYSKFPVCRKLDSTTATIVIQHMKSVFAEYGIPEILITDNGPQFSCREFATLFTQWGVKHVTSSPTYAQSNGHIERMVQTVKNTLKKADASGEDPYLAMLSYRTTPVDGKLPSPAQCLNNRKYRTQLPCSGKLQRLQSDDNNVEQLQHRQDHMKQQYDKKCVVKKQLEPGQDVSVFLPKSGTWTPATVKEKLDQPRSYKIGMPGGNELRRNRIDLNHSV
ncbi:uncharacterized protein K02A2.6-like [Haliotis rubra]|uniref:uncharacterized protein K02A2.6-like n=1 Tax=Haliotis rubra TaxID=36100 RepID=UPI001EE55777|nr:uncharacterized protein K02A2.6-like [Haliotis rubra]